MLKERLIADERYETGLVSTHAGQGFSPDGIGTYSRDVSVTVRNYAPRARGASKNIRSIEPVSMLESVTHRQMLYLPSSHISLDVIDNQEKTTVLFYQFLVPEFVQIPGNPKSVVSSAELGILDHYSQEVARLEQTCFRSLGESENLGQYFIASTPDKKSLIKALQATRMII